MSMNINTTTATASSSWLEAVLWRHRILIGIVLLHLLGALAVSGYNERSVESGVLPIVFSVSKTLTVVFAVNFIVWRTGYGLFVARPKRLTVWLFRDIRQCLRNTDAVANALTVFVSILVMAACFAYLKDMIPVLAPFSWDPYFAQMDATLHGGVPPWQLLWPLFGAPYATTALNVAYRLWFFLLYLAIFVATIDQRDQRRRMQFLIAFVLTWILGGNVLATVFSSAGPVFTQALGFGDAYVVQMEGLRAFNEISPVWSLDIQDLLIGNYLADGPIRGISAMPSMHVANATLIALFGFSYSRRLGRILVGFAAIIMIGSVHLGWHYAIDGYAGFAVALACWWLGRVLVARFP